FQGLAQDLGVEGFHALASELAGVFDLLLPDAPELWIGGGIIGVRGPGMQHASRTELLQILGILLSRIVEFFGLFLRIQVGEIAKPLVEAMVSGQEFIAVPEVILSELCRRIAQRFQHLGQGGIFLLNASRRPWNANRSHTSSNWELAHDESRASGGAAGLTVV